MTKGRFHDVPAGADSPLTAAVSSRDRSTLAMVEQAVKHHQTLLAFQPVVIANDPKRVGLHCIHR